MTGEKSSILKKSVGFDQRLEEELLKDRLGALKRFSSFVGLKVSDERPYERMMVMQLEDRFGGDITVSIGTDIENDTFYASVRGRGSANAIALSAKVYEFVESSYFVYYNEPQAIHKRH